MASWPSVMSLRRWLRDWYEEHPEHATTAIALTSASAYALSYFWRYPVFMLPRRMLNMHVATLFGVPLDLAGALSMAFVFGFGCAKPFAMTLVASPFFFRHRLACLLFLFVASAAVQSVGVLLAGESNGALIALSVYVSAFLSSFLFGASVTYLEGRRTTEGLLAVITGFLIYAGNASRGTASVVLAAGCPARLMPALVALATCPVACLLVVAMDAAPPPSELDVAARSRRGKPMAWDVKRRFFLDPELAVLTFALVPAYAIITAVRSFRDLYTSQLFGASMMVVDDDDSSTGNNNNNGSSSGGGGGGGGGGGSGDDYNDGGGDDGGGGGSGVSTALYFLADLPGAVLSVLALLWYGRVKDSRACLWRMLSTMAAFLAVTLASTAFFTTAHDGNNDNEAAVRGFLWQLVLGSGIFVTYSVMGTPFFER